MAGGLVASPLSSMMLSMASALAGQPARQDWSGGVASNLGLEILAHVPDLLFDLRRERHARQHVSQQVLEQLPLKYPNVDQAFAVGGWFAFHF